jgi:hypothetical protein
MVGEIIQVAFRLTLLCYHPEDKQILDVGSDSRLVECFEERLYPQYKGLVHFADFLAVPQPRRGVRVDFFGGEDLPNNAHLYGGASFIGWALFSRYREEVIFYDNSERLPPLIFTDHLRI